MTPKVKDLRVSQLRREHEIIWVLETIGARSSDLRKLAETTANTHRTNRDDLRALLLDAGQEPPPAEPGYESRSLQDEDAMKLRVQALLAQIMQIQLELIPVTQEDDRKLAINALTDTAVSSVSWGAPPQAFPGLD